MQGTIQPHQLLPAAQDQLCGALRTACYFQPVLPPASARTYPASQGWSPHLSTDKAPDYQPLSSKWDPLPQQQQPGQHGLWVTVSETTATAAQAPTNLFSLPCAWATRSASQPTSLPGPPELEQRPMPTRVPTSSRNAGDSHLRSKSNWSHKYRKGRHNKTIAFWRGRDCLPSKSKDINQKITRSNRWVVSYERNLQKLVPFYVLVTCS